jgi:hypothetical protein
MGNSNKKERECAIEIKEKEQMCQRDRGGREGDLEINKKEVGHRGL